MSESKRALSFVAIAAELHPAQHAVLLKATRVQSDATEQSLA
jgi:hypothetical protein